MVNLGNGGPMRSGYAVGGICLSVASVVSHEVRLSGMSGEFEANSCIEICESRVRLGFFLVGGIVMTLGSLFTGGACIGALLGLLGRPPTTTREFISVTLMLLIGGVGVLLFGLATIQVAARLFGPRTPVLFLTRDGFKDVRVSSELIPWSTILSLDNYRDRHLRLTVDRKFIKTLRLTFPARFLMTLSWLFGYHILNIATFPLENMSARKLLEIMRDRIGRLNHP